MKHLIISDVQVKPDKDYWFLEAIGNYIVDTKPDVIVCIGDFADMPSLSQYDVGMKCVDKDTEFLTLNGWKKISEFIQGDFVAVYDMESQNIRYEQPIEYVKIQCNDFLHFKTNALDMMVTDNHRMIYKNLKDEVCVDTANNIFDKHNKFTSGWTGRFITTFGYESSGLGIEENLLRLLTAFKADGSICGKSEYKRKSSKYVHRFSFKRKDKIERIKYLLNACNLEYKEEISTFRSRLGFYDFYTHIFGASKQWDFPYYKISKRDAEIIIDEIMYWDGCRSKNTFKSVKKIDADFIQYCFSLVGQRSRVDFSDNKEYNKNGTIYSVHGTYQNLPGIKTTKEQDKVITKVKSKDGYAYCFKTSTTTWVSRREGYITVQGNSFEGRRYRDDILSTHEAMSTLLSPIEKEKSRLIRNKKRTYSPRMVLTLGNNECFDDQTEVLTKDGWKLIKDVRKHDEVYTLAPDNRGEWQHPTGFIHKPYEGKMYTHSSRTVSTSVTPKHRVVYSSNGKRFEKLAEDSPNNCELYVSAVSGEGVDITDQQLKFVAVALTDSFHQGKRLTFYQSGEKADVIRSIIEEAGVHYNEKARDRNITQVCGKELKQHPKIAYEFYMDRPEWCVDNNKRLPTWLFDLSERQFNLFLDVLIFCDGTIPTRSIDSRVFYGKKQICEDVQALCVTKGYRATLTEYRPNQWRVNITKTTRCRVESFLTELVEYDGMVYCLSVPNETLLTRRNYKPSFSGNCRITKAVEKDRKLEGTLSISDLSYEEFGWEVIPFLKPIEIDGIFYSHYFCSGVMGRAFTSADRMVKALHSSCVMGHVQDASVCITQKRADGIPLLGLFTGLSTIYPEDYLNPQTNLSLRQIWELSDIRNGFAIPTAIPLDYLIREYL